MKTRNSSRPSSFRPGPLTGYRAGLLGIESAAETYRTALRIAFIRERKAIEDARRQAALDDCGPKIIRILRDDTSQPRPFDDHGDAA